MVGSMALKVENNLVSSHKFATQHYLTFISSMRLCWFPHLANGIDDTYASSGTSKNQEA